MAHLGAYPKPGAAGDSRPGAAPGRQAGLQGRPPGAQGELFSLGLFSYLNPPLPTRTHTHALTACRVV